MRSLFRFLPALSTKGFSLIEVGITLGVSSLVVIGGAGVLKQLDTSKQSSDVQSLIDREFAAGSQLAANASRLAPFVKPASLGDCLLKDKSSDCAAFGNWQLYPNASGPGAPIFQSHLTMNGSCVAGAPACLVERQMRFRWLCNADQCTGLETEISATPVGKAAGHYRPRTTLVKIDRRAFFSRAQLSFVCEGKNQTMRSVDYSQLTDLCEAYAPSNCNTPNKTYDPLNPGDDCSASLDKLCLTGLASAGLDNNSVSCQANPQGRTLAGGTITTASPANISTGSPVTAVNTTTETTNITMTDTQTTTITSVSTVTTTVTGTGTSPPQSGTWVWQSDNAGCLSAQTDPGAYVYNNGFATFRTKGKNYDNQECYKRTIDYVNWESQVLLLPYCAPIGASCDTYTTDPYQPPGRYCFVCK